MAGIFISYRRDDQPGFVGRLSDTLIATYGPENVFRDVDDICPGDDFIAVLDHHLRQVDIFLVVIGPGWLIPGDDGTRRIDAPSDFVRREIQAALMAECPVFPVLVADASMPGETDLPDDIRALARFQAVTLSDRAWKTDLARLIDALDPLIGRTRPGRKPLRTSWRVTLFLLPLIAGAVFLATKSLQSPVPPSAASLTGGFPAPPEPAEPTPPPYLAGRWTAQVTYDWGAQHEETFVFEVDNNTIHGTASYLRVARTIENAKLDNGKLTFTTHSQEVLGNDPPRRLTHQYRGSIGADALRLTLESSGGSSDHTPVKLIALPAIVPVRPTSKN